jgi:type VI protein secretion system component VasK
MPPRPAATPTPKHHLARSLLYFGPLTVVAGVGVLLLYRAATILDGAAAERAFVYGIILLGCAALATAARNARRHRYEIELLEERNRVVAAELSDVKREVAELKVDIHSRIAMAEWLKIFDRVDAHAGRGWIQAVPDEVHRP